MVDELMLQKYASCCNGWVSGGRRGDGWRSNRGGGGRGGDLTGG